MKIWSYLLLPFAWAYGGVIALRNFAYDRNWKASHAVKIPVISIGNITAGGTGKTPMAEFLLEKLSEMGHRPAYLSRGYGRKTKGFELVMPANGTAATYGDEALQVASHFPNFPVVVCEDRVVGATRLMKEFSPSILVLDDAFQHRRIQRDIDLVMIDCTRPPHEDFLIPAGRLREGQKGLKRAHVLTFSKYKDAAQLQSAQNAMRQRWPDLPQMVMDLQPKSLHQFRGAHNPLSLDSLKGQTVIAFSGIGNNHHFQSMLENLGLNVAQFFHFPDHFSYTQADIKKILATFEGLKENKGKLRPALILTTEKDYFRLNNLPWMAEFSDYPLAFIRVGMHSKQGWEQLEQKIKEITRERL